MAASAQAVSAFMIIPRHVLGGRGHRAPSDKLNIAAVGIGGMGSNDVHNVESENIIALCDVDAVYARNTFERYPDARRYTDYRKMLEKEKEIDAVMVATPDHTHAVIAMAALKAGKHVFCQKPLAHDIREVRALIETAKDLGLATQMGIQGHATEDVRLICEWIWDGAIGTVKKVDVWCSLSHYPPGHSPWSTPCLTRPESGTPVPKTLNWDLWLGPVQYRPYSPCYHPVVWRNWWDFGSSMMADRGCHTFDPIFAAMKLGSPASVEAVVSDYNEETYPVAAIVNFRFPKRESFPELEVTWYEGLRPPKPKELEAGRELGHSEGGVLFTGSKGKMMCGVYGESPRLIPESKMKRYRKPKKTLPRSPGIYQEWLDACRNRTQATAHFGYSGALTEAVLLGNIAKRMSGKVLEWDGKSGTFTNLTKANQYLQREYREGWSL